MSMIKIEHVDPNTSQPIAFDIMRAVSGKDPDGKAVNGPAEIAETFVLRHGQFKILALSGDLVLHEVSAGELAERERVAKEKADLEAEVAAEQKAKAEAERVAKLEADRAARKAEIEKAAGETAPAEQPSADKAAAENVAQEQSHRSPAPHSRRHPAT